MGCVAGRGVGEVPRGIQYFSRKREEGLETLKAKRTIFLRRRGEEWVRLRVIDSAQDRCCVEGGQRGSREHEWQKAE